MASTARLQTSGAPVNVIWQSWGHSQSKPVPGELGDGSGGYLDLSGGHALVSDPLQVASGQSTFATTAAGAPTSRSEISAVEMNSEPGREPSDVPDKHAEYVTPPLAANTDVVGLPTVDAERRFLATFS